MPLRKTKEVWEFGDFQTPDDLTRLAIQVIVKHGIKPQSVIEPTCGRGAFLVSAIEAFSDIKKFIGVDINKYHLDRLRDRICDEKISVPIEILHEDFFTLCWSDILNNLPEPILIVGNPPWVTSAELGMLESSNLPKKSNFQGRKGLEAITGKSNFDISEWMLLKHIEWLKDRKGIVAMLCKTAVARKILTHAWKNEYHIGSASIYKFDALKYFNASVDACLFVIIFNEYTKSYYCDVYENIADTNISSTIGYHGGIVVANISSYKKLKCLHGKDETYVWRSGAKHDCSKIMELERDGQFFRNGNGVKVLLEETYIYPMFKSSDIGNGYVRECRKYMLVTQKRIGDDTSHIEQDAPKTWRYLQNNSKELSKRASSIYKNRPPFSIFGVGDYTFSPWKVAISGFYKNLNFKVIGPFEGRPALFDDTIYFLACWSESEANFIAELLNSEIAKEFLESMIFWNDKRPITIDLLKRLDIHSLARELGRDDEYIFHASFRLLHPFPSTRLSVATSTPNSSATPERVSSPASMSARARVI